LVSIGCPTACGGTQDNRIKMTKLRHYDNLNTVRFLTFSCHNRLNLFVDDETFALFLNVLSEIKEQYKFKLYGYVVMPNHVHLVIYPLPDTPIGKMIGQLKSKSAKLILGHLRKIQSPLLDRMKIVRDNEERFVFWQRRCYDHNCRNTEFVNEKIRYCHKNPVIRGLVKEMEDYQWSSYNYHKNGVGDFLSVDPLENHNPTASGGAPLFDNNLNLNL